MPPSAVNSRARMQVSFVHCTPAEHLPPQRLLRSAALAVLAALLITLAMAPKTSDAREQTASVQASSPDHTTGEKAATSSSGLAAIAKIIPVGHEQKSVVVPNYSGTRISSLIRASKMQRLDDERLALKDVIITSYDDSEAEEMVVTMPTAIYHLQTAILEGTSRSSVSRDDFDLFGDTMLFVSSDNFGRAEGNLHMTIKSSSVIPTKNQAASENRTKDTNPQ